MQVVSLLNVFHRLLNVALKIACSCGGKWIAAKTRRFPQKAENKRDRVERTFIVNYRELFCYARKGILAAFSQYGTIIAVLRGAQC